MSRFSKFKNREIYSIIATCIFGWMCSLLAIYIFKEYAFGLFIWLPFVMGVMVAVLYGYNNAEYIKGAHTIALWTMLLFSVGMLIFAWEGLICLIMAAPLGALLMYAGSQLGFHLIRRSASKYTNLLVLFFTLSVPALMAFENAQKKLPPLRSVHTTVVIHASAEKIWKNVIAFPQLQEPSEFIFKTGIAYPINATITGVGVGAVRHCNFSTGSFTEPITIWKEPSVLEFSVVEQPEPMKEMSLYDIHPNHLHGYWVSKKGQFKLTKLGNNKILLEGTTWYENKIKPGFYWTMWSDYVVHKIHERVLQHIKEVAENSK